MMTSSWILAAVVIMAVVAGNDALTCYDCSGDINCNDAFSASGIDTITQDSSNNNCIFCEKRKTISYGSNSVFRGCITTDNDITYEEGCWRQKQEDENYNVRCYCTTDYCNGATMAVVSMATIMGAFLISKLFM